MNLIEFTGWLRNCPLVVLHTVLGLVVTECVQRKLFAPGKLVEFVESRELIARELDAELKVAS